MDIKILWSCKKGKTDPECRGNMVDSFMLNMGKRYMTDFVSVDAMFVVLYMCNPDFSSRKVYATHILDHAINSNV